MCLSCYRAVFSDLSVQDIPICLSSLCLYKLSVSTPFIQLADMDGTSTHRTILMSNMVCISQQDLSLSSRSLNTSFLSKSNWWIKKSYKLNVSNQGVKPGTLHILCERLLIWTLFHSIWNIQFVRVWKNLDYKKK